MTHDIQPVFRHFCDWELIFCDKSSNFQRNSFQRKFSWLTSINRLQLSGSQFFHSLRVFSTFCIPTVDRDFFFFFLVGGTKARHNRVNRWIKLKNKAHRNLRLWEYEVEQDNSLKGKTGTLQFNKVQEVLGTLGALPFAFFTAPSHPSSKC